jgi:hypothetical protein
VLQSLEGGRNLPNDGHDCICDARADHQASQGQHTDHRDQGQHQGQGAAELCALPVSGEQVPLDGPHGHIQDKGQGAAQQKRRQNPKQPAQRRQDCIQALQCAVKRHTAADHQQKSFDLLFVPFHER